MVFEKDAVPFAEARQTEKEGFFSLSETMNDIFNQTSIPGHGNGVSRSNYTKADLRRLFEETQPIVLSNIANRVHIINDEILPLYFTEAIKMTTTRYIEQPVLPTVVPAFAGARTHRLKTSQTISKSERYGHGIEVEGDLKNTPEGRARIYAVLQLFGKMAHEQLSHLAVQTLSMGDQTDIYTGALGLIGDPARYDDAVREQVRHFGIMNKDPLGMEKVTGFVKSNMLQHYGFEITHMIMPPNKAQTLRSTGNPRHADYYMAGPEGPKNLAGKVPYLECLNVKLVDAPIPLANRDMSEPGQHTIDHLGRHVVLGDFAHLKRFTGMTGKLEWEMYSTSDDQFMPIAFLDVFKNNQRFMRCVKGQTLDWPLDEFGAQGGPKIKIDAGDTIHAPRDGYYLDVRALLDFKSSWPDATRNDRAIDPYLKCGTLTVLPNRKVPIGDNKFIYFYKVVEGPGHHYVDPEYIFRRLGLRERAILIYEALMKTQPHTPATDDWKKYDQVEEWRHKLMGALTQAQIAAASSGSTAIGDNIAKISGAYKNAADSTAREEWKTISEAYVVPFADLADYVINAQHKSDSEKMATYKHIVDAADEALEYAEGESAKFPTDEKLNKCGDAAPVTEARELHGSRDNYVLCDRPAETPYYDVAPWSDFTEHLVKRILSVYRMQDVIYVAGGTELGYSLHSKEAVYASNDTKHTVWDVQWRAWFGVHIKNWDRVVCIPNAIYNGAVQGCNALIIDAETADKYARDQFMLESQRDPSVYAIAFPSSLDWKPRDIYIHTSGQSPHAVQGVAKDYPGAAFYNWRYGWTNAVRANVYSNSDGKTAQVAPFSFRSTLKYMTISGVKTITGATHHGIHEVPGCREVRDRGATVISTSLLNL